MPTGQTPPACARVLLSHSRSREYEYVACSCLRFTHTPLTSTLRATFRIRVPKCACVFTPWADCGRGGESESSPLCFPLALRTLDPTLSNSTANPARRQQRVRSVRARKGILLQSHRKQRLTCLSAGNFFTCALPFGTECVDTMVHENEYVPASYILSYPRCARTKSTNVRLHCEATLQ